MFISGLIGDIKPCASIYHYLLKKAKLKPQDCIVIDDQLENVEAARACGMIGVHFNGDARALRDELKKLEVL
jgi:HAD superfamily hydrolase (TIGR01509 family)